ncbi:MAG TPA: glyoxalase [Bacteroidetes bacterium]|nr:glyoxalase [Bacteroidota bacterium]
MILKLRPEINRINTELDSTVVEKFQNNTLRPILKIQHDLLILVFHSCLIKNKILFEKLSESEKESTLNQLFQKDLAFRNQSLGIIIGLFTLDEYHSYEENSGDYTKRITTMLKQRILSTYDLV